MVMAAGAKKQSTTKPSLLHRKKEKKTSSRNKGKIKKFFKQTNGINYLILNPNENIWNRICHSNRCRIFYYYKPLRIAFTYIELFKKARKLARSLIISASILTLTTTATTTQRQLAPTKTSTTTKKKTYNNTIIPHCQHLICLSKV